MGKTKELNIAFGTKQLTMAIISMLIICPNMNTNHGKLKY
jgi:hypothetical protein